MCWKKSKNSISKSVWYSYRDYGCIIIECIIIQPLRESKLLEVPEIIVEDYDSKKYKYESFSSICSHRKSMKRIFAFRTISFGTYIFEECCVIR